MLQARGWRCGSTASSVRAQRARKVSTALIAWLYSHCLRRRRQSLAMTVQFCVSWLAGVGGGEEYDEGRRHQQEGGAGQGEVHAPSLQHHRQHEVGRDGADQHEAEESPAAVDLLHEDRKSVG